MAVRSGSALRVDTSQDTMSTQRYYIDELLNAGVRHLDVRTGLDNNTVRIVHSSCHARNRSNQDLKLSEVMGWINDFLDTNPTETVIFQVKVDAEGDACERETRVAGRKIKKGTYYKFLLAALDKNNNVVSTSKVIHVASKGGKVTNPKKVTVKKGRKAVSKVSVKKGKAVTVKNSVTKASKKLRLKTHRKVQYESGNEKIATVTSKGQIKGIKEGTCYIYAYAQNGAAKKIKVTVN